MSCSTRWTFDFIATILHLITVVVGILTPSFIASFSGSCLVAMEIVALIFHVLYITCYRGQTGVPRQIKWIEYGISATLGTIAVLHIDNTIHADWIVFVAFVGNAQQTLGLLIDAQYQLGLGILYPAFVSGCFIQLGEYIFVAINGQVDTPVYWTYVFFYAIFGIHAFVGLTDTARNANDYVEEIYSLYGFVAKLAVFYAEYFAFAGVAYVYIGTTAAVTFIALMICTLILFVKNRKRGRIYGALQRRKKFNIFM